MTRAEITYGLKALPPRHRLHESARRYFNVVAVLPWKAEAADVYADIKHQLKIAGTPIGELDMMIAAHAVAANATLVTNNTRHFERIKMPLMLQNWLE
ncbi:tRNA(fMet)-specific endonuclease VapC [Granulicella aggregans]|uniref:tRNA(fMet)-specific endonuclease VapC n=2 Tax=Granulicella aggregans TaxID=474949 RepID=A0A7W7ZEU1_9BACT|nr:tRNA(fMet)-specific endonuclease VapC [Granulicella aggregans]